MKSELGPAPTFQLVIDGMTILSRLITSVLHFCQPEQSCTGVQDGYADLGDDRANDGSFSQGTIAALRANVSHYTRRVHWAKAHLAKGKEDTFEKGSWFIHGLLDGHVGMHAQFFVFFNLFSDMRQQDVSIKALRALWVQVGCEDFGGGINSMGCPFVWFGDLEDGRPGWDGR